MDWNRGPTVGRGSTATVSTATSSKSGEVFAVKSAHLAKSEFLQREQKILSTLSSPHVVSYIGYEITQEDNKLMYNLLMEYVPGGTIADEIRRRGGKLEESAVGFYGYQILQGLEYLHSIEVAHCDIKGQNILIGEDGVKLADFGCARWVNQAAAAVQIGGTPIYMAPEVARGEEQGCSSDIWAFGCTVIEMATGGSPWSNVADPVSALYRIGFSGEVPEFPEFLSGEAKDFLRKCLCKDPKQRWTAKQLLKHPFLAKFNSNLQIKEIPEFNSSSPSSVLDLDVWRNSIEETESLDFTISPSCSNSPAKRIGRLSSSSGATDWSSGDDENWVTVREEDHSLFKLQVTSSTSEELVVFDWRNRSFSYRNNSDVSSELDRCKSSALPFNQSSFCYFASYSAVAFLLETCMMKFVTCMLPQIGRPNRPVSN